MEDAGKGTKSVQFTPAPCGAYTVYEPAGRPGSIATATLPVENSASGTDHRDVAALNNNTWEAIVSPPGPPDR